MSPLSILPLLGRVPAWAWAAAALVAWGAIQRYEARHYRAAAAEATLSANQQAAGLKDEREQRSREQAAARRAQETADAYAIQRNRAQAAATAARDERDRLRDALAAAAPPSRAGSDPAAAGGVDDATRRGVVVNECATALQAMAAAADQAEERLRGLQDYVSQVLPMCNVRPQADEALAGSADAPKEAQ